jgi:lipopolysaccharide export system permease protein
VFFSILHRMILWEMVKVFVLALLAITGILLMAGIVAEASQQGLGPAQILAIIPLLIPSTLPYTIPATTLFATCLVYGRLAADNEILAIKAAGVNIFKVVWPAVLLGAVISAATMGLYYRIIPYTHHLMRTMFLSDVQEVLYNMLRRDKAIQHPKIDFMVVVRQVQGHKLIDAVFKRRDKNGHIDVVIRAREAELDVDAKKNKLMVHMHCGDILHGTNDGGFFLDHLEAVDLPAFIARHPPKPRDMTWKEMGKRREKLVEDDEAATEEIAAALAKEALGEAPPRLREHLDNLNERRRLIRSDISQIDTEYQMRPALSLGCLCFVLIGCPVGIWFSRSDYLSAFITCFLPIVFLYYPLMLCGTNFAKEGKLHPALTVWAADALVALVGLVLYTRLAKH